MVKVIDRNALIIDPKILRSHVMALFENPYITLGEEQYQFAKKLVRSYHLKKRREQIEILREMLYHFFFIRGNG
jgi:hypothetical protein